MNEIGSDAVARVKRSATRGTNHRSQEIHPWVPKLHNP
jgi:hypothetical protein